MSGTATASPQQALAVYAEPLVAGRRVVVFGESDTGVAERLTELGARTVVSVAPGEDAGDLRPATFDLALVPDLGAFDDAATVLAVIRRVVGENGAALVAAAAEAIDYYELFDLVAREFVDVRMIAQVPFHGVALAELGTEDESPAVSVDTQLVGQAREPDVFVALASQRGASLDPYAIVGPYSSLHSLTRPPLGFTVAFRVAEVCVIEDAAFVSTVGRFGSVLSAWSEP